MFTTFGISEFMFLFGIIALMLITGIDNYLAAKEALAADEARKQQTRRSRRSRRKNI